MWGYRMVSLVLQQRDIRPTLHGVFVTGSHIEAICLRVMQHALLDRQLGFHVGVAAQHGVLLFLTQQGLIEYFEAADALDLLRELLLDLNMLLLVLKMEKVSGVRGLIGR